MNVKWIKLIKLTTQHKNVLVALWHQTEHRPPSVPMPNRTECRMKSLKSGLSANIICNIFYITKSIKNIDRMSLNMGYLFVYKIPWRFSRHQFLIKLKH